MPPPPGSPRSQSSSSNLPPDRKHQGRHWRCSRPHHQRDHTHRGYRWRRNHRSILDQDRNHLERRSGCNRTHLEQSPSQSGSHSSGTPLPSQSLSLSSHSSGMPLKLQRCDQAHIGRDLVQIAVVKRFTGKCCFHRSPRAFDNHQRCHRHGLSRKHPAYRRCHSLDRIHRECHWIVPREFTPIGNIVAIAVFTAHKHRGCLSKGLHSSGVYESCIWQAIPVQGHIHPESLKSQSLFSTSHRSGIPEVIERLALVGRAISQSTIIARNQR